jgi:hypothetical protein
VYTDSWLLRMFHSWQFHFCRRRRSRNCDLGNRRICWIIDGALIWNLPKLLISLIVEVFTDCIASGFSRRCCLYDSAKRDLSSRYTALRLGCSGYHCCCCLYNHCVVECVGYFVIRGLKFVDFCLNFHTVRGHQDGLLDHHAQVRQT